MLAGSSDGGSGSPAAIKPPATSTLMMISGQEDIPADGKPAHWYRITPTETYLYEGMVFGTGTLMRNAFNNSVVYELKSGNLVLGSYMQGTKYDGGSYICARYQMKANTTYYIKIVATIAAPPTIRLHIRKYKPLQANNPCHA